MVKARIQLLHDLPEIDCRSLYKDDAKPHRWELLSPVEVCLSNGEWIHIPVGFITDFASVPRLLWGVVPTIGNHNLATLIHDYLYVNKYSVTDGQDEHADRLFADLEMLYWLRERKVKEIKCQAMYSAVRIGGKKWWLKN